MDRVSSRKKFWGGKLPAQLIGHSSYLCLSPLSFSLFLGGGGGGGGEAGLFGGGGRRGEASPPLDETLMVLFIIIVFMYIVC